MRKSARILQEKHWDGSKAHGGGAAPARSVPPVLGLQDVWAGGVKG